MHSFAAKLGVHTWAMIFASVRERCDRREIQTNYEDKTVFY
jgi:Na+-translocating ferredoxin:NAD+ oxidoreductase RnfA subunit